MQYTEIEALAAIREIEHRLDPRAKEILAQYPDTAEDMVYELADRAAAICDAIYSRRRTKKTSKLLAAHEALEELVRGNWEVAVMAANYAL